MEHNEIACSFDAPHRKGRLIGRILLDNQMLDRDTLETALEEHRRTQKRLGEVLICRKAISPISLSRCLAERWELPFEDLSDLHIDQAVIDLVSESMARAHRLIPIRIEEKRCLRVAMTEPLDLEVVRDLGFSTGMRIAPVVAPPDQIQNAIALFFGMGPPEGSELRQSASRLAEAGLLPDGADISECKDELISLDDKIHLAPVVQLVDLIIKGGIQSRASDIHIEPEKEHVRIRFRIDGLLRERARLPKQIHAAVVSRLKVLSRMDIAERRIPQDGSICHRIQGREMDLRVSTLPTQAGEKVVIRILDREKVLLPLESLGFSGLDLSRIQSLLSKKHGILLVTGPTGSGKTTTLYSMIQALQSESSNVVTVEDPIEYNLCGINQVQVNSAIGLTFASCLRAFLRQDPNIMLIGEIRDLETAESAIRAAMTGHLVLSTLHTNTASGAITRLLDLGIPRFLVASSVIGCIAQRLVRKLCLDCRVLLEDSSDLYALLGNSGTMRTGKIYGPGTGCVGCDWIGYQGRIGLFEILEISPFLGEQIARGTAESGIRTMSYESGVNDLWHDGLEKVYDGRTSPDELFRVIEPQNPAPPSP